MFRRFQKCNLKDILQKRALNSIKNDPKGLSQNEMLTQLYLLEQGDRDRWENSASFLKAASGFAGACAIAYFGWSSSL